MFFDADGTGDTQVSGLVQITSEPDDPIYQREWDLELTFVNPEKVCVAGLCGVASVRPGGLAV